MTVDDATSGDALSEQRHPPGEKSPGELVDPLEHRRVDRTRHERRQLTNVPGPQLAQCLGRGDRRDLRGPRRTGVTVGDRAGDGPEAPRDVVTLTHQCRQLAVGRETPHQHRVINHMTGVVEDVLDAEVDVRAEPSVQRHLTGTHLGAQFARAQVDEREADRLLDLVDQIAIEHDRRHVRLDGLDARTSRVKRAQRDR